MDKTREASGHVDAMRRFAHGRGIAEDNAVSVYEDERGRLARGAKVQTYVGVLAEKRAKDTLRKAKPRR
jgi:Protein of unknown function (DUF3562)